MIKCDTLDKLFCFSVLKWKPGPFAGAIARLGFPAILGGGNTFAVLGLLEKATVSLSFFLII
jgi:hypothetical protein